MLLAFVCFYAWFGLRVSRALLMAGASITVMLLDDELQALLEAPANSPFFRDGTPS